MDMKIKKQGIDVAADKQIQSKQMSWYRFDEGETQFNLSNLL